MKSLRGFVLVGSALLSSGAFSDPVSQGNRYHLPRYYQGEIRAAQTYREAVVRKGWWFNRSDRLIILDVRDASEYKSGHPPYAYHFPFPRIYQDCLNNARSGDGGKCLDGRVNPPIEQDPEDLFLMVEAKFPDKSQRFATVCRTGARSVKAANVLSKPEKFICDANYAGSPGAYEECVEEYAGRGYTRVSNMWQGFVGQPKAGIKKQNGNRYVVGGSQVLADVTLDVGGSAKGFIAYDMDLNNDDQITSADSDGWAYHQGLPVSRRMHRKLMNEMVDAMGYYNLP